MKRNASLDKYGWAESAFASPKNESKVYTNHTSSRNSLYKNKDEFIGNSSSLNGRSEIINEEDYY